MTDPIAFAAAALDVPEADDATEGAVARSETWQGGRYVVKIALMAAAVITVGTLLAGALAHWLFPHSQSWGPGFVVGAGAGASAACLARHLRRA